MGQHESVAENERFGRYLRKIREERRLSLDAVEEMSLGFRERVTKSHLSRIENGQAIPTFPRMFTLSQIYGVPVTILAERFEIELWREMSPAELAERSDHEIIEEAAKLKLAGKYLEAMSLVTAAVERRAWQNGSPSLGDDLPALLLYQIDCLVHLERFEAAKTECELVLGRDDLKQEFRLLALHAFVICCYRLKRFTVAQMGLREAEQVLRSVGEAPKLTADLEANRAAVLYALGQTGEAAKCFERASSLYQSVSEPFEACKARINLGQALIEDGNLREAQTHLKATLKVAEDSGYDRLRALALSHLGLVAFRQDEDSAAEAYALRSNAIARPREYLSLLFRNCYYLWMIASRKGDQAAAKANERTLRVYLGRIEPDLPEVVAFRRHLAGGPDEDP